MSVKYSSTGPELYGRAALESVTHQGNAVLFFRRLSLPAAPSGAAPFTIQFEMSTGRSSRELPTVRMAFEEYEILELAGAVRIKVLDKLGVQHTKAQLRDLASRPPVGDGKV